MKKIIAVLLVVSMALLLIGCGAKNVTFDDALKASVLSDDYAPGQTDDIVIVEHIVYKDAK